MHRLIMDKRIGKYRFIAFGVSKKYFMDEALRKQARQKVVDMVKYLYYDLFKVAGLSEEEIEKIQQDLYQGRKTLTSILADYGIELDMYYLDVDDAVAETIMNKILASYLDRPVETEAMEEAGYGLPEYSLYMSADARSYTGRWLWSGVKDYIDICYGLITEEDICGKIRSMIDKLEAEVKKNNEVLFVAVLREQ